MQASDPTPQELSLFVHLGEHLLVQKGGSHPPVLLLFDCWFWAGGEVPEWAGSLAEANAPGWTWCPRVNPTLPEMTEPEQWVEQVLTRA